MQKVYDYWRIILAIVLIFVGGLTLMLSGQSRQTMIGEEQDLVQEIADLKTALDKPELTESDLEPTVEVIEQGGLNSRKMGEKMIVVQKTLASFYKTHESLDESEDLTTVRNAEKDYTRMTGSTDYGNTWLLNKDWTMTLESVATYADERDIPIVFSMHTKDNKLAGLVRGNYDPETDLMSGIVIDYTVDGNQDQPDVGGK